MKANFLKLPDFLSDAAYFGALASATNLSKMLAQDGCPHVKDMKKETLRALPSSE